MISNKINKFKKIYKAAFDIGFIRLQKKVRFQIRSLLDRMLPLNLRLYWAGINGQYPIFINDKNFLGLDDSRIDSNNVYVPLILDSQVI